MWPYWRRSAVSARVCERASVFSSCWYMRTTSVSPYLLSSVCFKWHMCIVKRHTYLWVAEKQPNTNTGFFWIQKAVDCSDFEHNARNIEIHTTWRRLSRDNCVFHSECLSLAISSLSLNLKWGTGRRSGYISIANTLTKTSYIQKRPSVPYYENNLLYEWIYLCV